MNFTDILVDITGRTDAGGNVHQKYLGLSGYVPGWNKTYGGTGDDYGYSVVQTGDGGFAIAGSTNSSGAGGTDVLLVKMDASGNQLWNKTYGGTGDDFGRSLVQTSDGGFAIAGSTWTIDGFDGGIFLVKTDASGNQLWNKTYGGSNPDEGFSVVQTSDGGFAMAGYTGSFGAYGIDVFFVKTDANGNQIWLKSYRDISLEYGYSVIQTSDGGYAITGYASGDILLVKWDASGNQLWNKTYAGIYNDCGYSLVQTIDGGFAIAGYTYSSGAGGSDVFLVKTDASGNQLWNKTYGGTNDDFGRSLFQTGDGGFAIAGYTASFGFGVGYDAYLVKTDAMGNQLWQETYGGANSDEGYSLVQTSDGGFAIAGSTNSSGAGGTDVYLVKTDVEGEFGLARVGSTLNTLTLYRGFNDVYWNYVRVRIWKID